MQIGPVRVGLEAGRTSAARLTQRYGAFVEKPAPAESAAHFLLTSLVDDSQPSSDGPPSVPRVRLESTAGVRLRVSGDCSGSLDLASGRGVLERGDGFVGMDMLVRLSLSVLAPVHGWIVFHGAAIDLASGGWALLLGRSGAGKSTAAKAFRSYCDEWVLARPVGRGVVAASTPYWNGRPGRASCRVVVCLERTEHPATNPLRGREAVRTLAEHVIRHLTRDDVDRYQFAQLCAIAERVPVVSVGSRSGDTYPADLCLALGTLGFAPRSNEPSLVHGGFR